MEKKEAREIAQKIYWHHKVDLNKYSEADRELINRELYFINKAEEFANDNYYGGKGILDV